MVPAIGDERLKDMRKGTFSLSAYYPGQPNQPLRVPQQKAAMLECAGAGWAEVIRALGRSYEGDGYGMFNAPLNANALYPAIADWENETIRLDMDSTQP